MATTGQGLTNYYEAKFLDHLFGNVSFTPPTTVYLGLGKAKARLNNTAYSLNDLIIPGTYAGQIFKCSTAGTTAGSEPGGYTGAAFGATVTDGTAVFTEQTMALEGGTFPGEIAVGAYARQSIAWNAAAAIGGSTTGSSKTSSAQILFPQATADYTAASPAEWLVVAGIWDALTNGNLLAYIVKRIDGTYIKDQVFNTQQYVLNSAQLKLIAD
jgi:hypothetical protein